jgi:hypothetical protein
MSSPAIEARALRRTFKGGIEAVRDIDLTVSEGEVFGFLGPNGAGKTTTVRMLCTLLPPTSGSATVAGLDVEAAGPEVRKRIGVALQEIGHRGIARVALVLAAGGPLAGPVDCQAGDVDDLDPGLGQQRAGESGDPAHDVNPDSHRPVLGAQRLELLDQGGERLRAIVDPAIDQQLAALAADRPDPVELLRHVDPDSNPHLTPLDRGDHMLLDPYIAMDRCA